MLESPRELVEPLLAAWRRMLLIRGFEQRAMELVDDRRMWGAVHPCIGQEAIPVGVSAALEPGDKVVSNHRGHGHLLARGADLVSAFAELMGRRDGMCRGRGGSMHLADLTSGIVGTNGIVGGGASIGLGVAFAAAYRGTDQVTVVYLGDGAMSQGGVHESILLSLQWRLPVLWVCENNRYAVDSPISERLPAPRVVDVLSRALTAYEAVDGNDYEAVQAAAAGLVDRVRTGQGAAFLECASYRLSYHSLKFRYEVRPEAERAEAWAQEPLGRLQARLEGLGVAASRLEEINADVASDLDAAIRVAEAMEPVTADDALKGTFAAGDDAVRAMTYGWREELL